MMTRLHLEYHHAHAHHPPPSPAHHRFKQYAGLVLHELAPRYGAVEHWAKVEVPEDAAAQSALRVRLQKRYPVHAYNRARQKLDPRGVLSNDLLDWLFDDNNTTG